MKVVLGPDRRRFFALVCLLPLLALGGCTGMFRDSGISVTQTGANPAPQAVPAGTDPEDEVIGRREHPRIIASYGGVYSDRAAEIMLARIAGRLMAAAQQPNVNLTVTILDSPDVNAFALPGGYIYVTRGILALANDESELAAVIAHEIAHVTLRHARARSNRTRTSEIVDRVISGVLGADAATDQSAARSRMSLAAFSQAQELQADREGIVIAGRAGYEPQAAARFLASMGRFARFASGGPEESDDFLSSHPSTPDRIEKAIESARALQAPEATPAGRTNYLAAIDGLAFGDNPNNGAVVGQRFIHPTLGFTFTVPARYTLQTSRNSVVAVAGDGEAVRFDSAQVPEGMALQDYVRSGWIAGLIADSVRQQTVNGLETVSASAKSDQWAFRIHAVRLDGKVYRFIFASRTEDAALTRAATETFSSFRRATTADLRQIRRAVVRTVTARQGDTTAQLAARMAGVAHPGELFLILNNLFAGDVIEPGVAYKIVTIE